MTLATDSQEKSTDFQNAPSEKQPPSIKTYKISSWFNNCAFSCFVPHLIQFIAPDSAEKSGFSEAFPTSKNKKKF